jgi:hypothetical protein|tara:strand:- start:536 stop:874 length:339 start_codon:yes stop_codon:yes gene_type:complete
MASRYRKKQIFINNSEYYAPLRRPRHVREIRQYGTQVLPQPSVLTRSEIKSDMHIWSYGDRLYNLAHKYYGDVRYWWVIAWWNGYPTESDISTGVMLSIPLSLEKALKALGY